MKKNIYITLIIGSICSIGIVVLLYSFSADMVHRQRDVFIRQLPPHVITKKHELDLGYNSYYIAGVDKDKIYLGNNMAPFHLLVVDSKLKDTQHIKLNLNRLDLPLRSLQVRVTPPYFYMTDGSVPAIFKGKVSDWKASLTVSNKPYFTSAEPVDSSIMAIRTNSISTKENVLGTISMKDSIKQKLFPDLLKKQIDGIFCTDGKLLVNKELQKVIYVYSYRNQFIVANVDMEKEFIGKTIDTISKAQIDVVNIDSKGVRTLSSQPLVVNRQCSTNGNYLFVSSNMLGKYEPDNILNVSSVIDVYDLNQNTYALSFYLLNHRQQRMTDFEVYGDRLIAILDKSLVIYELRHDYFKYLTPPEAAHNKLTIK